jgi:RimJ/RimL family protein N-acetyltransferase
MSITDREAGLPRTERLLIEPLGHEHTDALFAALGDPRVDTYLDAPEITTIEALRERIHRLHRGPGREGEQWLNFAVRRADDGVVVGRIEATLYGDWAEIAYVFGPAHWGHGYAREATAWLLDELGRRGAREAWAAIQPNNARSIALVEKLGLAARDEWERDLGSYAAGDRVFMRPL